MRTHTPEERSQGQGGVRAGVVSHEEGETDNEREREVKADQDCIVR